MRSLALVKARDTTELDFEGYYFRILGWQEGYLKIIDDTGENRLPLLIEGKFIHKFETMYDLIKYVREHSCR